MIGEITGRSWHRHPPHTPTPPHLPLPSKPTESLKSQCVGCSGLSGLETTALAPDNASFTRWDVVLKGCRIISQSQTAIGSPVKHRALFTHLLDNNYLALWLLGKSVPLYWPVPQSVVLYAQSCGCLCTAYWNVWGWSRQTITFNPNSKIVHLVLNKSEKTKISISSKRFLYTDERPGICLRSLSLGNVFAAVPTLEGAFKM